MSLSEPLPGPSPAASQQGDGASDPGDNSSLRSQIPDQPTRLPDVAQEMAPDFLGDLERVGMSGIELAATILLDEGKEFSVPADADAYVSLDSDQAKGIHMSRLFLELDRSCQHHPLSPQLLNDVCSRFLESHTGISLQSELKIGFRLPIRRPSLVSGLDGQRHYPVVVGLSIDRRNGKSLNRTWFEFQVTYSSTCPCSAALSRQVLQQHFEKSFADRQSIDVSVVSQWLLEHGSVATPHSQRSLATVRIVVDPATGPFPIESSIRKIEAALQTPVQAVVKRSDEQQFARLNGSNLMFCEDAARRMKEALLEVPVAKDFRIEARHMESLHPHDAVAVAVKGVAGGLTA